MEQVEVAVRKKELDWRNEQGVFVEEQGSREVRVEEQGSGELAVEESCLALHISFYLRDDNGQAAVSPNLALPVQELYGPE